MSTDTEIWTQPQPIHDRSSPKFQRTKIMWNYSMPESARSTSPKGV